MFVGCRCLFYWFVFCSLLLFSSFSSDLVVVLVLSVWFLLLFVVVLCAPLLLFLLGSVALVGQVVVGLVIVVRVCGWGCLTHNWFVGWEL